MPLKIIEIPSTDISSGQNPAIKENQLVNALKTLIRGAQKNGANRDEAVSAAVGSLLGRPSLRLYDRDSCPNSVVKH